MIFLMVTSLDYECDIFTERAYIKLLKEMSEEDFQTHIAVKIRSYTVKAINKPIITETYLKEVTV